MPVRTTNLNIAIRKLCKSRFRGKALDPDRFVEKFKEVHPDLVEEYKEHFFDSGLKDKARSVLKNTPYDLKKKYNRQISKLPHTLPLRSKIEGKTISNWIKRKDATLKELTLYGESLSANVKACAEKSDTWADYLSKIKPYLLNNPDWTAGDAEKQLFLEGENLKAVENKKAA